MTTAFSWHPEPALQLQLLTLAQQQGRSPETIVTQAVMSYLQAQTLNNSLPPNPSSPSLEQRRAFLKLPLDDRQRILQAQAETLMPHYKTDREWQDLQVDDLIDY